MKSIWILLFVVLLAIAGCKHNAPATASPVDSTKPIRVSTGSGDGAEPAITSASDGTVYVAWVEHHQEGKADVLFARFNNNQMQGSAIRVNPQPGAATAWRGDPPTISVAPDQTIFISWTAKVESESGHATDIYVSASRDKGTSFDAPVKVNDDKRPAVHGMHSLSVAKDGRLYVAWLDERNISPQPATDMKMKQGTSGHHMESNREVFIASSTDNGRTFSANKQVATNVCPCCKTALATAGDGRVYLSWRQVLPGNFRHIAVTSSTDQGQTFSTPKIVSDDQWMLAGCPVSGATINVSNDGALHVLWYSAGKNGETGLYSSESKDAGNTFGPRTLIAKGEIHGTPVLTNGSAGLVAVWENSAGKISTARLGENNEPVQLENGNLPAAVETSNGLMTAYIDQTAEPQAIFVSKAH
ncbi:MAG TPA: sialidase family protein [Pyrinomonadaceae bacterium]